MVFYEDGEPIIDGEPGDLKVSTSTLPPYYLSFSIYETHFENKYHILFVQFRIRTAPHDRFKREGNDLHTTITITLV